jgi:phosphoribosylformimino-5-aminoimidazole carboxamide ribotide isomerase
LILYPAIDLKDGNCVRLLKGDMNKETIFNNKPEDQAKSFEESGCEWIHLVDLNGAFEGVPVNSNVIQNILKTIKIPAQLGGGIRNMKSIEHWIDHGLSRIILGTVAITTAVTALDLVKELENMGVCAIIYTDIDRDGAMNGPNISQTENIANSVSIPVIASGGISSMADLKDLKSCNAALNGVISGRAIYEKVIDIKGAINLLRT